MASIAEMLKASGYQLEKSTVGEKPILNGVYLATLVACKKATTPDGLEEQITADFKITETLAGKEPFVSSFPEFKGYYSLNPDKIKSTRSGLAKLLNGLYSVDIAIDISSDEAIIEGLENQIGSAQVYIKGFEKKRKVKDSDGNWVDGDGLKQDFTFLTEKNAIKEADKIKAKKSLSL